MTVPLSWLKDYVDIEFSEELSERITLAGLEVVSVDDIGSRWERDKVRVGEVLEVRRHPNADRLTIAVVDYGADEPQAVVTGAPNLKVGDSGLKVAFATVGATLLDGYSDEPKYVELKPTKIRGVMSAGMVCSEKELGLSDEHEGILILPGDAPVGLPLRDYLGDVVIGIDFTNDMAYCSNVVGIAREVAALTGAELSYSQVEVTAEGAAIEGQVTVDIEDQELCKRYSAALIKNVKIGDSPFWMQQRLIRSEVRPINVVVDITNYVMLELGQPLHAFDYRKLRPKTKGGPPAIIVRRARPKERIVTLDGVERDLTTDMLLITDGGGAVAVAGVMGGFESEVTESTTDILLEAANFDNISVRRTSQTLKLSTEAATRFGRGIDPELTTVALHRACELMRELAGGEVARGFADAYPVRPPTRTIEFKPSEVDRLAGIHLDTGEIAAMLGRLGFKCTRVAGEEDRLSVTIPSYRLDVSLPADLVEEVARMYGFERIPLTLLEDELPVQTSNRELDVEEKTRDILVGCGLNEIINYPLTNLESVSKLSPGADAPDPDAYIRIANTLTNEREFMRQTLMNTMLETVWANLRYTDRVALFEIGSVYIPIPGEELPAEPRRLCIAMAGPRPIQSWRSGSEESLDFYDLKGVLETLLEHLNLEAPSFEPLQHSTLHPGRAARLKIGSVDLGILGELHPLVRDAFDLPERPVGILELDMDALTEVARGSQFMEPISRYPAVAQDLAIIVDNDIPASEAEQIIRAAGGRLLVDVTLFDVYRGEQIPKGKKSLAYSLSYQSLTGTLRDKQVAKLQGRILKRLRDKIGAELRG